jgi:hypothetical protein
MVLDMKILIAAQNTSTYCEENFREIRGSRSWKSGFTIERRFRLLKRVDERRAVSLRDQGGILCIMSDVIHAGQVESCLSSILCVVICFIKLHLRAHP